MKSKKFSKPHLQALGKMLKVSAQSRKITFTPEVTYQDFLSFVAVHSLNFHINFSGGEVEKKRVSEELLRLSELAYNLSKE